MIKAGMVHLVLALMLRVVSAAWPEVGSVLGAVWWHGVVVGWLTQLIFAVAWWMFPTVSRETRRGSEGWMWASGVGLNGGLLLRMVGEPGLAWSGGGGLWTALLWASAVAQVVSVGIWIVLMWPRVRAPRSVVRSGGTGSGGGRR